MIRFGSCKVRRMNRASDFTIVSWNWLNHCVKNFTCKERFQCTKIVKSEVPLLNQILSHGKALELKKQIYMPVNAI